MRSPRILQHLRRDHQADPGRNARSRGEVGAPGACSGRAAANSGPGASLCQWSAVAFEASGMIAGSRAPSGRIGSSPCRRGLHPGERALLALDPFAEAAEQQVVRVEHDGALA